MWYDDERQKTEKYKIVIEMRIKVNWGGSVLSFKGCGMNRQRGRGWNLRIINILVVSVHLFLFEEWAQRGWEGNG